MAKKTKTAQGKGPRRVLALAASKEEAPVTVQLEDLVIQTPPDFFSEEARPGKLDTKDIEIAELKQRLKAAYDELAVWHNHKKAQDIAKAVEEEEKQMSRDQANAPVEFKAGGYPTKYGGIALILKHLSDEFLYAIIHKQHFEQRTHLLTGEIEILKQQVAGQEWLASIFAVVTALCRDLTHTDPLFGKVLEAVEGYKAGMPAELLQTFNECVRKPAAFVGEAPLAALTEASTFLSDKCRYAETFLGLDLAPKLDVSATTKAVAQLQEMERQVTALAADVAKQEQYARWLTAASNACTAASAAAQNNRAVTYLKECGLWSEECRHVVFSCSVAPPAVDFPEKFSVDRTVLHDIMVKTLDQHPILDAELWPVTEHMYAIAHFLPDLVEEFKLEMADLAEIDSMVFEQVQALGVAQEDEGLSRYSIASLALARAVALNYIQSKK